MVTRVDYSLRDPVEGILLQLGTFTGIKGIKGQIVPLPVEWRARLLEILKPELQDLICANCGSTKSDRRIKNAGAESCCDRREMVPGHVLVNELNDLKANAKRRLKRRQAKVQA